MDLYLSAQRVRAQRQRQQERLDVCLDGAAGAVRVGLVHHQLLLAVGRWAPHAPVHHGPKAPPLHCLPRHKCVECVWAHRLAGSVVWFELWMASSDRNGCTSKLITAPALWHQRYTSTPAGPARACAQAPPSWEKKLKQQSSTPNKWMVVVQATKESGGHALFYNKAALARTDHLPPQRSPPCTPKTPLNEHQPCGARQHRHAATSPAPLSCKSRGPTCQPRAAAHPPHPLHEPAPHLTQHAPTSPHPCPPARPATSRAAAPP